MALLSFMAISAFCTALLTWNGFVLMKVWAWFVAPTFGAPSLGLAQAIGVALVASLLTHQVEPEEGKDQAMRRLGGSVLSKAMILGVAWIVKGFL